MVKTHSYEDRQSLLETGGGRIQKQNNNNNNNNKNRKRLTGGRDGKVDGGAARVTRGEEGWWVSVCGLSAGACVCVCLCASMWQKLGGIERALTLCLYGPTVNGDKGPARGAAQLDDVAAHMPSQFGEAGGLEQEGLLGLHGGLRAPAVSHWHHVVGLAKTVTPQTGLLRQHMEKQRLLKMQSPILVQPIVRFTRIRPFHTEIEL